QYYPDVAAIGVDPIRHYVAFGAREGRDPSPSFDTRAYLARYPDVAAAQVNPFAHFISFGIAEGRVGAPSGTSDGTVGHGVDGTGSQAGLPAVTRGGEQPGAWLSRGARRISRIVSRHVPLLGRLRLAWRTNRDVKLILSSPLFDPAWYRRRNPDVPE